MPNRIPTDELLDALQELADELGETPKCQDMNEIGRYTGPTYQKRFGSWNGGLIEAGLPVRHGNGRTDEDLIDELHDVADELGRVPRSKEMTDYSYDCGTFRRHFGSWNAALEAAELEPYIRRDIPVEKLREEMHRLADELERTPREDDMTEYGEFGESTYLDRFGTWNDALKSMGYEPTHRHSIPSSDLIDELHRLEDILGRTPAYPDMLELGEYDPGTYENHFGSWNQGLREAGLPLNMRWGVQKSDLLAGLHRLADELGRRPSADHMMCEGEYDVKSYRRVFGSWDAAIIAAGYEPYEPPTGEDNPRWIDGGSKRPDYYGPNWTEQRSKAIDRDGEQCAISYCDVTRESHQDEWGMDLPVHHIVRKENFRREDGSLDYEAANETSNLITLCSEHHPIYEGLMLDTRHLSSND
jgi:hypothetical protein